MLKRYIVLSYNSWQIVAEMLLLSLGQIVNMVEIKLNGVPFPDTLDTTMETKYKTHQIIFIVLFTNKNT